MSATTRRELWLGVALSAARDGLPAPSTLSIDTGVNLVFYDASEAAQWGAALNLDPREVIDTPAGRLIHTWFKTRAGVMWSVTAYVDRLDQSEVAESLAAQVVDAIVNDRPQETIAQPEAAATLDERPEHAFAAAGWEASE